MYGVSLGKSAIANELMAIMEPTNEILCRLKGCLQQFTAKKDVIFGYSRTHHRHNRS